MIRPIPNRILYPALGFVFLAGGCGPQGPPDRALGTPPPPPVRPSDGLLRRETLQRLVDFQVDRDGGALIGLLADPDAVVRARAAFALGSVQDPAAGPPLSGLLMDPEAPVRRERRPYPRHAPPPLDGGHQRCFFTAKAPFTMSFTMFSTGSSGRGRSAS